MAAYRKKTMYKLTHITTPIMLVCLAVFFGLTVFLSEGASVDVAYGVLTGVAFGAVIMGLVILVVRAGCSDSRMEKEIMRAVEKLGLGDAEQYQLASEMLSAKGDSSKELAFESMAPNSTESIPVCVTVTEHFAYMKGDAPFVNIIRLANVDRIEATEEKRQATKRGAKVKAIYTFHVYAICFFNKAGEALGGFGFFDENLRDRTMKMLGK